MILTKNIFCYNDSNIKRHYKTITAIISYYNHDKERKAIQETWMQKNNHGTNKFLFFIGRNDTNKTLQIKENHIYLPFQEKYRKLTTKILYAFLFIHFKYEYDYIIKVDDDVYLNMECLYNTINQYTKKYDGKKTAVYMGKFVRQFAIKNKRNKWYEPKWLGKYPSYAIGPTYILSKKAVNFIYKKTLVKNTTFHRYVNEDVSIGIWFQHYGQEIKKIHVPNFVLLNKKYRKKNEKNIIIALHHVSYLQQYIYWKMRKKMMKC